MAVNVRNLQAFINQYIAGGTAGSILFIGTNKELQQDNANLFWDDSNNRLGVGTATPTQSLEIGNGNIRIADNQVYGFGGTSTGLIGTNGSSVGLRVNSTQVLFVNATKVAIGNNSPNASAKLDVDSTTLGFLPPRMTTTQKNAISSPATGLVVFDTTLVKLCVYNGATWETVTSV